MVNKRINESKMNLQEMKLDLVFDRDWKIQSGIISVEEGYGSIHFTVKNNSFENFDFFRNNVPLNASKMKENDVYRIYSNELHNKYLELNLNTGSITYYKKNESDQI